MSQSPKCNKSSKRKPSLGHAREVSIAAVAILVITAFALFPAYRGSVWSADLAAKYGDFVGGYFGTVFLVVSVAIIIVSYRNQKQTNDRTVFESHFFELLRYHRENTHEIEIEGLKGRRCFVSFIREWRLLLELIIKAESKTKVPLDIPSRSRLSYLAFFHGSGPNGSRSLKEATKNRYSDELLDEVLWLMTEDWKIYKKVFDGKLPGDGHVYEMSWGNFAPRNAPERFRPLAYVPFEGHHSRLAHYFRHLFHIVDYADSHAPGSCPQEYINLVTAQLTTHEQAVLALHASSYEGVWRNGNAIQDFHLIKDLPNEFLRLDEFDVRAAFPDVAYVDSQTN